MIDAIDFRSPNEMAVHLARYVTCPSSIVAGTANHFGKDRAIPIDHARRLVSAEQQRRERLKERAEHKNKDSDEHDGVDFAPRGLVKSKRQMQARFQVRPVHDAPKADAIWPTWYDPKTSRKLPRELITAVGQALGFTYAEMIGQARDGPLVGARSVAATILRGRGLSFPQIGRFLGKRDHSTVINMVKKFPHYAERWPGVQSAYEQFRDKPDAR